MGILEPRVVWRLYEAQPRIFCKAPIYTTIGVTRQKVVGTTLTKRACSVKDSVIVMGFGLAVFTMLQLGAAPWEHLCPGPLPQISVWYDEGLHTKLALLYRPGTLPFYLASCVVGHFLPRTTVAINIVGVLTMYIVPWAIENAALII